MPDTRHSADAQPFARREVDKEFDADSDSVGDGEAQKYFAVLTLDGDEMGKWVSGLHPNMPMLGDRLSDYPDPDDGKQKGAKVYFEQYGLADLLERKRPLNPSFHLQFSEMLANFGNFCVRRIVESFDGRLIYSGGDDVLALLPAHTAIPCARALRAAFQGEPKALNKLTGAWRRREREWRKDNVRLFEFDQPAFIRLHEDAPRLEGEPKKFYAMVPGPAADCSVGIAIAHFKSPLQEVVRAAQAAEKRAKKELGRSAVAVTLRKRSGETIEWGCQWKSKGLEIYDAMLKAVVAGALSNKFPHRLVELLEGYRTETAPLSANAVEPVPDFDAASVIERELAHVIDRQSTSEEARAALHKEWLAPMDGPEGPNLLRQFLRWAIEQEARAAGRRLADKLAAQAKGKDDPPEAIQLHEFTDARIGEGSKHAENFQLIAKRLVDAGPKDSPASKAAAKALDAFLKRLPESQLEALIGLCQTVAFIARNLPEDDSKLRSPKSEIETTSAEMQPVTP